MTVYNLSPRICMMSKFMFLSMVIPSPSSPGQNIDVCLRPLIDELTQLWSSRALTYDISRKQNFVMRTALMWTINDFPAYGMVFGWSTHGKLACPYCMENNKAFTLTNMGKASFFYCHHHFLPPNHRYRKQKWFLCWQSWKGCCTPVFFWWRIAWCCIRVWWHCVWSPIK